MLQKIICMLGSFSVGKTSLVRRFVESLYSDTYHTTVGVKVDKKVVREGEPDVMLMLWDIYGEDEFQKLRTSYLRGAAGYLFVADGTRLATLEKVLHMRQEAEQALGAVPCLLALNKCDLTEQWEVEPEKESELAAGGWSVLRTSAKSGEGVDEAFHQLARRMLGI
jgi:small GTP-binding protein